MPAPPSLRSGARSASTRTMAALEATVASSNARSSSAAFIVELLQQAAQFGDVLATELAVLAEVRHQRRDATAEQALEQALALLQHPLLALEQRRVEVTAAVLLRFHRALVEQAVEQGLDGGFLPLAAVGQGGDHVLGAERMAAPEHVHDGGFGFADLHRLH